MKKEYMVFFILIILCGVVGGIEYRSTQAMKPGVTVLVPDAATDNGTVLFERKMSLMRYVLETNPQMSVDDALIISSAIVDACDKWGLDPAVIASIIKTESNFDFQAIGKQNRNDRGLGQINTRYWKQHLIEKELIKTEADLFQPHINAYCTAYILRHYLDRTGSYPEAIMAYHGGRDMEYLNKVLSNI